MILQLTVFSLLLLLVMLAGHALPPGSGTASRRYGRPGTGMDRGDLINAAIRASARTYLLFAPYALLLYLQGKPDLLPQYLAWIVIGAEVVRGGALYLGQAMPARALGAVNALILAFLWFQEFPVFQSAPA